jgi:hypothetical protein
MAGRSSFYVTWRAGYPARCANALILADFGPDQGVCTTAAAFVSYKRRAALYRVFARLAGIIRKGYQDMKTAIKNAIEKAAGRATFLPGNESIEQQRRAFVAAALPVAIATAAAFVPQADQSIEQQRRAFVDSITRGQWTPGGPGLSKRARAGNGEKKSGSYGGPGKGALSVNGKSLCGALQDMIRAGHDRAACVAFAGRILASERHDKDEKWVKAMARRHCDVATDIVTNGRRTDQAKKGGGKAVVVTGADIARVLADPLATAAGLGMDQAHYAKIHEIIRDGRRAGWIK